jgi:SlyX protein
VILKDRIEELESRIAFQDSTLEELNDVIVKQQFQIDKLEKNLEMLSAQLKNMAPSLIASEKEETPPPHY